ncbi:MAG TPA: DegQ family serine endoprotease [Burkholderiaceae bacterium]|nr:DegQ family serine endoprotease [Burkholderiaceae bacterium]HQR71714.1 DegQ family serine endoprotease [Burkholderiaceae bacterium]
MIRRFAAVLFAPLLVLTTPLLAPSAHAQATQVLPDFADLAERAGPAVVNIRTTARVAAQNGALPFPDIDENDPMYEFFRRFFPNPPQQGPRQGPAPKREVPRGLGSGFIVAADGYVMTNAHVVDGADDITVTLADKREFKGKLIGADRRTDVALVKIEATGLPTVKIGDPNRTRVGEWVVAIGSPFGLENSVTAGIVSAKARETGEFLPFIQTDVAVNPGNSGGPLLNMRGEVIGINSQIFTTSGGYNGISFAIPIDEAMNVQQQLRASGRVIRGRIGVGIESVSKEVAEAIGLGTPARGALVNSVEKDGPAAKGGVEAGDVILRFDGRAIERSSDLPRIVGGTKPGTSSTVTVYRKGAQRDLKVLVGEMPQDRPRSARTSEPAKPAAPANALGLGVSDVSADKLKELGLKGGVQVDAVDGLAAAAGLRPGDIITQLNSAEVQNAKQFNDAVARLDSKKDVAVLVRRGEASRFVIIRR